MMSKFLLKRPLRVLYYIPKASQGTFTTYAQGAYVIKVPFKDLKEKNVTSLTPFEIKF